MKRITAWALTLWLLGSLPLCARAEELPPAALALESLAETGEETAETEEAEEAEETEEAAATAE